MESIEDCKITVVEDFRSASNQPVPMSPEQSGSVLSDKNQREEVEMEYIFVDPVTDIDSCDVKNSLAVVDYVGVLYAYYREMEVHYRFELREETLFLTVNLIDRFLSRESVLRKKLQLVGLVAVLLACKYEEVSTAPIKVEINHGSEVDEIFDAISYMKGASVIRMLQSYIGAECFQDKGIRIWKMVLRDSLDISEGKRLASLASYIEGPLLVAGSSSYHISLESLLIGHEDWVYSVEWHPPLFSLAEGTDYSQPLSLLSASMDKTMMIWQPEKTSGIWMNVVTVGELSHCALGFYGGHWSPDERSILAHGYGGSFYLWRNVGLNCDNWQPQNVPSGHHAVVSDIEWARSGEYFLSVSYDQTSRIFAPWKNEESMIDGVSWHEIARPQVHGHDINCVAIIQGKGNHLFVSGAEEKVARVFEALWLF